MIEWEETLNVHYFFSNDLPKIEQMTQVLVKPQYGDYLYAKINFGWTEYNENNGISSLKTTLKKVRWNHDQINPSKEEQNFNF